MENTLRRYAEIFDYFSSLYFFENIPTTSTELSKVWLSMDLQIRRTFSIEQIIEREFDDKNDFDFFKNLGILSDIDVTKQLELIRQVDEVESQRDKQSFQNLTRHLNSSREGSDWRKNFYDTLIRDTHEISFDKLYTNVILQLNKKNYLDFDKSLKHISFILNNLNEIKKLTSKELHTVQNSSINFYINYFYGTLSERNKILVRKVVDFVHISIEKRYPCLFIDTDEIIIKQKKDITEMLDFLGIPYHLSEISQLIIFNRKKFIKVYKNGQTRIRGFPELDSQQLELLGLVT